MHPRDEVRREFGRGCFCNGFGVGRDLLRMDGMGETTMNKWHSWNNKELIIDGLFNRILAHRNEPQKVMRLKLFMAEANSTVYA